MSLKHWWSHRTRLTDTQAARWEKARDGGRRRYVIVEGVLRFGVCCAVLSAVVHYLLGSPGPLWGRLALNLVMAPIFGFWFGDRMWIANERRYAEWCRGLTANARHQ
jgi:hypothetical protein